MGISDDPVNVTGLALGSLLSRPLLASRGGDLF